MLSWTEQKPSKPGWYWMLNPSEEPGLPTIVQINTDWESGRSLVLIPASSTFLLSWKKPLKPLPAHRSRLISLSGTAETPATLSLEGRPARTLDAR